MYLFNRQSLFKEKIKIVLEKVIFLILFSYQSAVFIYNVAYKHSSVVSTMALFSSLCLFIISCVSVMSAVPLTTIDSSTTMKVIVARMKM